MATQLGRKPRRERVYITLSIGCMTALLLLFVPVHPCMVSVVNPGKITYATVPTDDSPLAATETREVRTDDQRVVTEGTHSIFDTMVHNSELRSVRLQHPLMSWGSLLAIAAVVTALTWVIVGAIYRKLDHPFEKN